jgi:septum site-determining protein MinC
MEVSPRVVEANPSANVDTADQELDGPAGGPTAGDKAAGDKAAGDKAAGDKAAGDKAAGDKVALEEAAGDGDAGVSDSQDNNEAPAPVEVRDSRGEQKESSRGSGAGKEAAIETRWKIIGRTAAAPAGRTPVARQLSGLNRGNEALLIKTHCRSGEVIRYPGDVVVMADVNPGSEIIADGDILVFGSLRGFAHAGAGGDIQATIIAQHFETPRLQIGPYVGVDPKPRKRSRSNSSNPSSSNPRMAYVRRRSVYVAPYTGRFGEYSGGTLYDG